MSPHVDFRRLGHFHTGSLVRIHEQLVKVCLIIVLAERWCWTLERKWPMVHMLLGFFSKWNKYKWDATMGNKVFKTFPVFQDKNVPYCALKASLVLQGIVPHVTHCTTMRSRLTNDNRGEISYPGHLLTGLLKNYVHWLNICFYCTWSNKSSAKTYNCKSSLLTWATSIPLFLYSPVCCEEQLSSARGHKHRRTGRGCRINTVTVFSNPAVSLFVLFMN